MTDARNLPAPVDAVTQFSLDGKQYWATKNGWPLYYYIPTGAVDMKSTPYIPWIEQWPEGQIGTEVAKEYVPFPRIVEIPVAGFDYQIRGDGPFQATYHNWPVYTCKLDVTGPADAAHGILEDNWALVPIDLLPLPVHSGPVPYPPTISGP